MNMKRLTFAIIFACCTLAVAAQDIRVNYKGAKPSISDFITAYLAPSNDEEDGCDEEAMSGIRYAWERYLKGFTHDENYTFTLDSKNGFAVYEAKYNNDDSELLIRIEMCYWNEADGKHKLFAYNHKSFTNGKYDPGQYDGLTFMRYNNATKKMTYHSDAGVEAFKETRSPNVEYSCSLPHSGKDIIVTCWERNGKKTQKTLKWNGHGFSY